MQIIEKNHYHSASFVIPRYEGSITIIDVSYRRHDIKRIFVVHSFE